MGSHAAPPGPYHYISTDAEMAALAPRLAAAPLVAIDMEADSLHHYHEKLCLVQLTADGYDAIVDPLSGIDLGPLGAALAERPLIFHGADYDLRMLRRAFGFAPRGRVFDTMIAAQLLGSEQLGLAALVQRFFDVTLSKRGQKSDWSRRPLTPEQLAYAQLDTHFLPGIADALAGELAAKGRTAWFDESCAAVVHAAMQEDRVDAREGWRIKGARLLSRRELAFLHEIWNWREHEARRADLPRFKVLIDEQLLAIVRFAAAHPEKPVTKGPRLPRNCVGKRLDALEKAVARACALPQEHWPDHPKPERRPRLAGDCSRRIELLREACAHTAHELGISPSTIAPRAAIAAVAVKTAASDAAPVVEEIMAAGSLLRWQAELLAPAVEKISRKR